jgi:hypothetical protein
MGLQISIPSNYRTRNHRRARRGGNGEGHLSELADYLKEHGHCNVPKSYSENTKLAVWVANQRAQSRLHREGKESQMTTLRIQELESLGFEFTPRRVDIAGGVGVTALGRPLERQNRKKRKKPSAS